MWLSKSNQTWYGVSHMYLKRITKGIFSVAFLGKVSFSYGNLQFLRITNFNYSFFYWVLELSKSNQSWHGVSHVHLVCMTKRVFIIVCLGKKLVFHTEFCESNEITSKMGGTPFGRQDFSVLSTPLPSLLRSLARLSLVFRLSLARLSLVSRSSCSSLARLVRLTLVSRFGCLLVWVCLCLWCDDRFVLIAVSACLNVLFKKS